MVGVAVRCDRSPSKATVLKGSAKVMEEPSFCNLSLAVDCTLSLGFSASRTDIPARLSRAGSTDQDLEWSLSVRSEREVPSHRSSEQGEDLSWGGSCNRSDPDLSPEYYPQVPVRGSHASDSSRRGFKAWPRSTCKDEVNTSEAMRMSEDQAYSIQASRQPWLPNYLPSSVANKVDQGMEEGDSFVRVCAHCGTSKTPLWRNGPGGPKSLCNACGIRFKKAGRRTAANGTAESPGSSPVTTEVTKRKLMNDEPQYWVFPADAKPRKRNRGPLLHRTSDSLLSSSFVTWQPWSAPKSPFRVTPLSPGEDRKVPALDSGSFSSDEEEGAVLLMALSCGLMHA